MARHVTWRSLIIHVLNGRTHSEVTVYCQKCSITNFIIIIHTVTGPSFQEYLFVFQLIFNTTFAHKGSKSSACHRRDDLVVIAVSTCLWKTIVSVHKTKMCSFFTVVEVPRGYEKMRRGKM